MSCHAVVTGLGTIGPWGSGPAALAEALATGRVPLAEIDLSQGFHLPDSARLAGLVAHASIAGWLSPAESRRMSPASRLACAAARAALRDARLETAQWVEGRTAIALGTAFGSVSYTLKLLQQLREQGPEAVSPFVFMETVANAHAGQVALMLGAEGPNATITQREASGVLALAHAARLIESGACDLALAGAVEEMPPILHAVLDRFGALARSSAAGGEERARPFDRARAGFVAGEGAALLALEPESAARARGAPIHARVAASVRGFDPSASAANWGRGEHELAERLRRQLARQQIALDSIELVVAGASGSRAGDRLEALCLREVFRELPLPRVLVPKATTGEYGGGQLAAAVLALQGAEFCATPGFAAADPELGLAPHDGGSFAPPRRVLVSALAPGGAAAWIVLERP